MFKHTVTITGEAFEIVILFFTTITTRISIIVVALLARASVISDKSRLSLYS